MPRYFCDYCQTYLTHDSAPGRKQHNRGWKHRENVKAYYEVFMPGYGPSPGGLGGPGGPGLGGPGGSFAPGPGSGTGSFAPRPMMPQFPPQGSFGGPPPFPPRPGLFPPGAPGFGPGGPGGFPPRPMMGQGGPPQFQPRPPPQGR